MGFADFLFTLMMLGVLFLVIFYAVKFAIVEAHREISEGKTKDENEKASTKI